MSEFRFSDCQGKIIESLSNLELSQHNKSDQEAITYVLSISLECDWNQRISGGEMDEFFLKNWRKMADKITSIITKGCNIENPTLAKDETHADHVWHRYNEEHPYTPRFDFFSVMEKSKRAHLVHAEKYVKKAEEAIYNMFTDQYSPKKMKKFVRVNYTLGSLTFRYPPM